MGKKNINIDEENKSNNENKDLTEETIKEDVVPVYVDVERTVKYLF